jgi:cysteine desulfurase
MSTAQPLVYLDYAASTPVDPEVLKFYQEATEQAWANPNSLHQAGQKAKAYLENSRVRCAQLLNCDRGEIVFTGSATESNNLAIQGVVRGNERMKELRNEGNGGKAHVLMSSIEHDSVLKFGESEVAEFETVSVDTQGFVDMKELFSKVKDATVLISLMLVNNEIGTIQPIAEIGRKLQELNIIRSQKGLPKVYFHCDAVQAVNYLQVDVQALGVDLLTIGSQKIYAPKGAALLFIRQGTPIEPIFFGGGQEKDLRSGTPNVPAIYAFSKALEQCEQLREGETARIRELRDFLFRELKSTLSLLEINGFWQDNIALERDGRIANNVNFSLPNIDAETLLTYLDLHGFCVSAGSGCHSGSLVQSGVIAALGKNEEGATVRVSLGRGVKKRELEKFIEALDEFCSTL